MIALGWGDSCGDGVHSLRELEGSGVLSGVVQDRNEDGGTLGPSSCANAGRTHSMWGFRNLWGAVGEGEGRTAGL